VKTEQQLLQQYIDLRNKGWTGPRLRRKFGTTMERKFKRFTEISLLVPIENSHTQCLCGNVYAEVGRIRFRGETMCRPCYVKDFGDADRSQRLGNRKGILVRDSVRVIEEFPMPMYFEEAA